MEIELKSLLFRREPIKITFGILRRLCKTSRERLILDLIHYEMKFMGKKLYDSSSVFDQMTSRELRELYLRYLVSGWICVSFVALCTLWVTFGWHCSIFGHFYKTSNKYDLVVSSKRRFFSEKTQKHLNLLLCRTSNMV